MSINKNDIEEINKEFLQKLKLTDIENVDIDLLIDISDIPETKENTQELKIASFIKNIKNPYCFKHGSIAIKVEYNKTDSTLQSKLENYILNKNS